MLNPPLPFRVHFLEKLYGFYFVARFKSYRAAAVYLKVSVSTLSRAIQALEHRLAQPLLVRGTRAFQLTPMGEQVFQYTQTLVQHLEPFETFFNPNQKPSCVLSIEPWLSGYLIEPLKGFYQAFPDIGLEIRSTLADAPQPTLHIGFEKPLSMEAQPLGIVELGFYASRDYLGAYEAMMPSQHRLIEGPLVPVQKINLSPPVWRVGSSALALLLGQAGLGVLYWVQDPSLQGSSLIEVPGFEGERRVLYLSTATHRWQSPWVRYWAQHLRQLFGAPSQNCNGMLQQ